MSDDTVYKHLGPFSGLVAAARALTPLFPALPLKDLRPRARAVLRFTIGDEHPIDLRTERTWNADGIDGEELSWSVGFGPRAHAFLLRPAGNRDALPGILALYDHGHNKFYGKEKIADGPDGPRPAVKAFRETYYSGRAYANALAREGFAVLIHDTFLWGSRRFPFEVFPPADRILADAAGALLAHNPGDAEVERFNGAAYLNEHIIARYCTLLGTSLPAIIAYEDRVALNVLAARDGIDAQRLGCVGFSGGGLRAALLNATADGLSASVIACMMSTYKQMLGTGVAAHTWMLFPTGWSAHGDWPDLAAAAAPLPLLVQCALGDILFTEDGMRAADKRIAARYAEAGAPQAYRGAFYPGPHRFDAPMQEIAFAWLKEQFGA
jgi:dienelactone hydrolase